MVLGTESRVSWNMKQFFIISCLIEIKFLVALLEATFRGANEKPLQGFKPQEM